MAKRFFASEIWEEDWFLDMPNEYRWFWFYMLAKCDHAGVFRVNPRSIRGKIEAEVTPSRALTLINTDKQRIRVLKDMVWLIEDFFVFQYGPKFNINNLVHKSIANVYAKHGIDINSIRGLTEVNLTPKRPQKDPGQGAKDKDKDKDIEGDELVGGKEEEGGLGEGDGKGGEREDGNPELLLPQMHAVWKTSFPLYTDNVRLDYPALKDIAVFIFKTAGISNGLDSGNQIKVLNTLQLIADQVNREPFWVNKPLSAIAKNIQEFYNKIKNPINGTGSKSTKAAGVNDDILKQKAAEHLRKRRQASGKHASG